MSPFQKIINHGSCSYLVVFVFCAFSALVGLNIQKVLNSTGVAGIDPLKLKFVIADRQAVIFDHALNYPVMSEVDRDHKLIQPILGVLSKYSNQGYLVVDSLKDESGAYFVSAFPIDSKDITSELKAAVDSANRGTGDTSQVITTH